MAVWKASSRAAPLAVRSAGYWVALRAVSWVDPMGASTKW